MRTLIAAIAATAGSVAFQASLALWPHTLQQYAWAVKYVWILSVVLWVLWILTHPSVRRAIAAGANEPRTELSDKITERASVSHTANPIQTANPSLTANPTQTQNASAIAFGKYEEHHHYHAVTAPTPPPASPAPAPDPALVNVRFIGARAIKLTWNRSRDLVYFTESTSGRGDIVGLIACFRNEYQYGREVRPIREARSHVKLFEAGGQEIGTGFSSVMWLGNPYDKLDLSPGGDAGCVLFLLGGEKPGGGLTRPTISWKGKGKPRSFGGYELQDDERELNNMPQEAEIAILDGLNRPILPPIRLAIESSNTKITLRQVPQP